MSEPLQTKQITIPLDWWLDLALYKYGRSYVVIDLDLAAQITTVDPKGEVCYIENSSTTLDYAGREMPLLESPLVRCWSAKKYRESYDHYIKLKEESVRSNIARDTRVAEIASMRRDLVASYVSKQVPPSVAETLVNSTMSVEVVEIAWRQLKNIQ